jgi:hypothetical protein
MKIFTILINPAIINDRAKYDYLQPKLVISRAKKAGKAIVMDMKMPAYAATLPLYLINHLLGTTVEIIYMHSAPRNLSAQVRIVSPTQF